MPNLNLKTNLAKSENFWIFLEDVSKIIEPKLKEVLDLYVDKSNVDLINYQIEAGGKRLRPALAILSNLVCEGKVNDVLYPAAGLEILHNCTLIYDDIIDDSNLRRKKPTVWFRFGKSIAQCIGIDYATAVFQTANLSNNPAKVSEIFAKTMKTVVDGEILDILFEQSGRNDEKYVIENRYKEITLNDYLKMVEKKTAFLLKASCEIGAVCANASKSESDALSGYGHNLGIAFQIRDDILDIFGDTKESGKKVGSDIKERKLGNIVIFYALKELPRAKKEKILAILKQKKISQKDIENSINIIKETKAREKAALLGELYIKKAKDSLKKLPDNKWNKILNGIADLTIKREK